MNREECISSNPKQHSAASGANNSAAWQPSTFVFVYFEHMDLHDPLTAFVILFILSLIASFILFKLLDSRAAIKRKGWSAGGAIAGFLLILFGSWYSLRPMLVTKTIVMPSSTPSGFSKVSLTDLGLALAIPSNWERTTAPVTVGFTPKNHDLNHVQFLAIQTQTCQDLTFSGNDPDMPLVKEYIQKMMGIMSFRGTPMSDSFLGHKSSITPFALTFPKAILTPPTSKDLVINLLLREVYDERNARCITLIYPDDDIGRQIISTLNVADPER